MKLVTIEDIEEAAERLFPILRPTPLEHVHAVSVAVGRDTWVKEEQLQRTGSYKIRGAYNLISRLPNGDRVVAASAGNHAQGVALACSLTKRDCEIFMPRSVPIPKLEATEGYGARVVLIEGDLEDCVALAKEKAQTEGITFVPPFDDPRIIAGQGTVGLELARDLPPDVESIVVPVGGGGLISGVSVVFKELRPDVKVIGVEAAGAPTMTRSLREGRPVKLDRVETMADGIAMREVSALTLAHVREYVDDLVVVTEEEMSHAILILLERAKAVVEPGGAAALAAVLAGEVPGNRTTCAVLSGGNVDPALLMKLIDHGLAAAGRYAVIRVIMADTPGKLAELTRILAEMALNVVEVQQHRSGRMLEAVQVEVQMTIETRSRRQHEDILERLERSGFAAELLT